MQIFKDLQRSYKDFHQGLTVTTSRSGGGGGGGGGSSSRSV